MVETILKVKNLKEAFEEHINGMNFILEADIKKAVEMRHKKIIYSEAEEVFVVCFNENLKDILENKLKEMEMRKNVQS